MAKQVIILDTLIDANGNQNVRYAFWFAVSAGKQYPNPNAVSAYRGVTAAELAAIQGGTVFEQTGTIQYANGTATATIQTDLQGRWTAANTAFQALTNQNQFFGASWDGASWTAAPAVPPPLRLSLYSTAGIQLAASGDNTIIAGTANQGISVFRLKLVANAAVTASIKDGATVLWGPAALATGVPCDWHWAFNNEPWFVTSAGNALVLNLSSAVAVSVRGTYVKG